MKRIIGVASLSMTLALMAQAVLADGGYKGAEQACGASVTEGLSAAQRAKMTEETRAIALKFFKSNTDEEVKMLTADAYIWSAGMGEIDRSRWGEIHKPRPGGQSDHGKPLSHKQTINYVTADGDRAAIDYENYVVFKDFIYDQKYHNLVVVRDGKVCALKLYNDMDQANRLIKDLNNYVIKK
jgi:hypothetical protein